MDLHFGDIVAASVDTGFGVRTSTGSVKNDHALAELNVKPFASIDIEEKALLTGKMHAGLNYGDSLLNTPIKLTPSPPPELKQGP